MVSQLFLLAARGERGDRTEAPVSVAVESEPLAITVLTVDFPIRGIAGLGRVEGGVAVGTGEAGAVEEAGAHDDLLRIEHLEENSENCIVKAVVAMKLS